MKGRSTWLWVVLAVSLFGLIYTLHHLPQRPSPGTTRILSRLDPRAVGSVQVRPAGPAQLEIRADRTNQDWQLREPLVYPAQSGKIEALLAVLAQLKPATYITPAEMRTRPKADEEYGFASPQASLIITQGDYRVQLNVGNKTAPGDQVFLQVVGIEGAYVVDVNLLKLIPASANDWRDTTVLRLDGLECDRLSLTNSAKAFVLVLQRDITNPLWRMVWPFPARADNARIDAGLLALDELRVKKFITDDPKADPESFGLATGGLELALAWGSNTVAGLQFGKSPTNDVDAVYARRTGQTAIFTVPKKLLAPWTGESVNDFRDPHLLTLTEPVQLISARAKESFGLQVDTNGAWRILPDGLPADAALVGEFLSTLTNTQIRQFVKDVVNPPELPDFGLAPPARQYRLEAPAGNPAGSPSNSLIAELDFGCVTNQPERAFARRPDETSVYAISTNDFARLPAVGWQLRERALWDFAPSDVARVTVRRQGKVRQIVHNGPNQWSLAADSLGNIEDLAVEETVRGLAHAAVVRWVGRGEMNRAAWGFGEQPYEITLQLKNDEKFSIEFGGETGTGSVYAAVTFAGQIWVGEFPGSLYGQVQYSLSVP